MAHYQNFRKRDLVVALSAAKRAGVPIRKIVVGQDGGFELLVGEPEIDAPEPARPNSWEGPPIRVGSSGLLETVRDGRRRIVAAKIEEFKKAGRPLGIGPVIDDILNGSMERNERSWFTEGDWGIGGREKLARLVERLLKAEP